MRSRLRTDHHGFEEFWQNKIQLKIPLVRALPGPVAVMQRLSERSRTGNKIPVIENVISEYDFTDINCPVDEVIPT